MYEEVRYCPYTNVFNYARLKEKEVRQKHMMFTDNSRGKAFAKDPAVVKLNGQYFMYYSTAAKEGIIGLGIGIATSTDLSTWTKIGDVTATDDHEKNGICAPGAIVLDNKVHLFYQTYGNHHLDAICHATSEDGINFERNPTNPIIRPSGDWNSGRAIDADVIPFGDHLYCYYASRDPSHQIQLLGVHRAPLSSSFLKEDWEQRCDKPVLEPELEWEQACIEAPAMIVKDDKVYMFYAGAYNNCPQQVGLAVSTDAEQFTRVSDEPFLRNGEAGTWNSSESGHPFIFEDEDERIYLFYQGNNDNGASWYLSKVELSYQDGEFKIL